MNQRMVLKTTTSCNRLLRLRLIWKNNPMPTAALHRARRRKRAKKLRREGPRNLLPLLRFKRTIVKKNLVLLRSLETTSTARRTHAVKIARFRSYNSKIVWINMQIILTRLIYPQSLGWSVTVLLQTYLVNQETTTTSATKMKIQSQTLTMAPSSELPISHEEPDWGPRWELDQSCRATMDAVAARARQKLALQCFLGLTHGLKLKINQAKSKIRPDPLTIKGVSRRHLFC